jgi:preprotein translocase subunit YajC
MRDLVAMMPLAALKPTTSTAGDMNVAATNPATGTLAAGTPANTGDVVTTQGATTQSGIAVVDAPAKPATPGWTNILLIGGMFVVLYFVMFRGQRKSEKSRKTLISQMKKGDKVMTIGGLVARVVSIDEDEVVLKIDESANVKATFKKSSIQQVLGDEKAK